MAKTQTSDEQALSEERLADLRKHYNTGEVAELLAHIAALAEQLKQATEERNIFRDGLVGTEAELAAAEKRIVALEKRFTVPVVCICGSTRFADEHAIARWMLEKTGRYMCLMINYLPASWAEAEGWDGHDHFGEAAGVKQELDDLHKRRIDLADSVLVIAPEGYVGESTRSEIDYAESLGRPVRYIEEGRGALAALDQKGD